MSYVTQQASQLLVHIKKIGEHPIKTKTHKTQWVGLFKNPGFSEPWMGVLGLG